MSVVLEYCETFRDDIGGSGVRPSVIAEQRRSRYELSLLQHVILLLLRDSCPCEIKGNVRDCSLIGKRGYSLLVERINDIDSFRYCLQFDRIHRPLLRHHFQ